MPKPDRKPERGGRPARVGAAMFERGDVVTSPAYRDWVGEVVDVSRLGHGYVTVRWRTPLGTSFQSKEERIESVVLAPPPTVPRRPSART